MSLKPNTNPWFYIPGLYFMEAIPYVIVNSISMVMFNKFGIPNGKLAFWTSFISLPWVLKMFWGPLIDHWGTKRQWILGCQVGIIALLLTLCWQVSLEVPWTVPLGILLLIAFLSASYDIAADGFYMLALNEKDQSFFVGIRSTAYRLGPLFLPTFLYFIANKYELEGLTPSQNWSRTLLFGTGIYFLGFILSALFVPKPANDHSVKKEGFGYKIFQEYFKQKHILVILGFILFYRFGESMVSKLSNVFFIDSPEKGGLGMSLQSLGFMGSFAGVLALSLGGIVGGMTLSRWGLKRCLWPMVLSMNVPNLLYLYVAFQKPSIYFVLSAVVVDQFGYGFGFSAYMVYLMFLAQDTEAKSSHFAISTGLMALGAMIAGSLSGYIQEWLGYTGFFAATLVCSIPGMLILFFLPLEKKDLFKVKVDIN